jgi:hypothetical protein
MGKMRDRMAKVKKQLGSDVPAVEVDPEASRALSLGFAYEKVLGEYLHRPALRFFTQIGDYGITPQTMGFLKKAVAIAEDHKVDHETYVRSQFYWFHKWFKRNPKVREMCSVNGKFPAALRLTEFLKLTRDTRVSSVQLPSERIPVEKLDRINEERVEQLMEVWGNSRDDTIKLFGPTGVFDPEWLERQ